MFVVGTRKNWMSEAGRKQTVSIVRSLKEFFRKGNEINMAIAGGGSGEKKLLRSHIYSKTLQFIGEEIGWV